jgi:hypothetical protein
MTTPNLALISRENAACYITTVMAQKTKIVASLPTAVELTRRTTQNSLRIDVKLEGSKEGSLHIAQGSVEWWPDYHSVNAHRANWSKFVALLESMPRRRSTRK